MEQQDMKNKKNSKSRKKRKQNNEEEEDEGEFHFSCLVHSSVKWVLKSLLAFAPFTAYKSRTIVAGRII